MTAILTAFQEEKVIHGHRKRIIEFTNEEFDVYHSIKVHFATECDNNGIYMFKGRNYEVNNTITPLISKLPR